MKAVACRYIAFAIIACLISCAEKEYDPESFLVYSVLFQSLSTDWKASYSNVDFWKQSGKPCFFKIDSDRYSYVSVLVEVGFGVTAWNEELEAEPEKAVALLKYMVNNGCKLDEKHPYTGHTAGHIAAFFTKKNPELAWYIFKNASTNRP